MTQPPNDHLLRQVVATHLNVAPDRVRLDPIRTGKHNRCYYVATGQGGAVLRIAPPQEGLVF
jgi:hypothetical protein